MRTAIGLAVLVSACSSSSTPRPTTLAPPPDPIDAAAVAVPDPEPPGLRLPGDVRPSRGELDLTLVPDRERFDGVARYALEVTRPTSAIWLDATGLVVSRATIGGQAARVLAIGDHVALIAAAPLAVGPTTIELAYDGPISRTASVGIYAEREGTDWYAYTFFEATDARRAFPCFDEPSFKIPWQVTLHVRRGDVALGNAAVTAEADEPDDMKRVTLAETRPLPSYLVAFVVGPFDLIDGGVAGRAKTAVRFVVPKGRGAETRYARAITPAVVTALEDYFDMDYPYGKLDVAVVPRYWGTMEHPGLVAMGQPLTLIKPDQETSQRKRSYTNILAHELAHYWFGDVVTMAWWDDTWLNESLASWLDVKITETVGPEWKYFISSVGGTEEAMGSDELVSARAMRQVVDTADAIQASFDNSTTYAKGAAVLHMFEQWIGPAKFRTIIGAYVRAHAWGNATADDFAAALQAGAGAEVASAFRTFLDQPGVPLIAHAVRCTDGKATLALTQRRALSEGVTAPTAQRWQVPVCVRHGRGKDAGVRTCALLAEETAEVALPGPCPTWLVPNADGDGYYRSTVTGAAPLPVARLTPRERLRAVGEVAAAHDRGDVTVDVVLSTGIALAGERDPRVAAWAGGLLYTARPDLLDDDHHARFLRLQQKVWLTRARQLGWQRRPADDDDTHRLRLTVVGGIAERDRALGAEAVKLAQAALRDPASVADDIAGRALIVAARKGDRALFDQVLAAARATTDRRQRGRLLTTLGAFTDATLAAAARDLLASTDFDQRESRTIMFVQLSHRDTRAAALVWIQAALPTMLAKMREDEAGGVLGFVAGLACDQAQRDELAALVTPLAAKYDGAQHAITQGLEGADRCIARRARDEAAVRRFLARY